uniref:Very-long-chain enoyl-CoA reductase n=1 Tax=Sinocyclocheilus grahami TaxID=75366 RepID=A0A672LD99_SINGR
MSLIFQVEFLDSKTKEQLCFLDKVEPHSSVGDIKSLFHKSYPKWYPARQALRLDPKGKALRDDDVLQNLPVGTSATFLACACHSFHYIQRAIIRVSVWSDWSGFAAWLAYYINHPLYTPPCGCIKKNVTFLLPHPSKNPFTWLFYFVSCPNYTYEMGAWVGLSIITQCVPGERLPSNFVILIYILSYKNIYYLKYINI